MKSIFMVITQRGDGSNRIEWHQTMSYEKQNDLEEKYPECYSSGDGFQCKELRFPDDFDLDLWAKSNHISWWVQEDFEEFED